MSDPQKFGPLKHMLYTDMIKGQDFYPETQGERVAYDDTYSYNLKLDGYIYLLVKYEC